MGALLDEALARLKETEDRRGVMGVLRELASLAHGKGDHVGARPLLAQVLAIARELQATSSIAGALEDFAAIAAATGRPARALRLAAAGAAERDATERQASPAERALLDRRLAPARQALDGATAAAAWAEGTAMGLEQAVAYALGDEE